MKFSNYINEGKKLHKKGDTVYYRKDKVKIIDVYVEGKDITYVIKHKGNKKGVSKGDVMTKKEMGEIKATMDKFYKYQDES